MRRIIACWFLVMAGVTGPLRAHDPESLPIASPQALEPVPMDAASYGTGDPLVDQLERVLRKLETLEPGDDEAALRAKARVLSDIVLTRKEAEAECLLSEIERLRRLTGQPQAVLVKLVAIEVRRDLLGDLAPMFDVLLRGDQHPAYDLARSDEGPSGSIRPASVASSSGPRILESNPLEHPLIDRLRDKRIVKVLAEPSLVSAAGRPASFHQGGQFPIETMTAEGARMVSFKPFGTQLEFVATVRPGNRLRLQTKFELAEMHAAPLFSFGSRIPSLTTRSVNTEIEMRAGQTAVIAGLVAGKTPGRSVRDFAAGQPEAIEPEEVTELCIFITPELVSQPVPPAKLVPPPADYDAEHLRKVIVPASFPDDLQYFPPTPIPRKGMLR